MLVSCETDIKTIENRIREMKDIENTVKERKKQMEKSVELLDGIIADGAISDTHLRMLVDEIVIYEKNGKLEIQITLNGEFRTHIDYYDESGDITDRHAEIWYFPNWESMAEGYPSAISLSKNAGQARAQIGVFVLSRLRNKS